MIEKTQKVESEKGEEDEVPFESEKFPFIFVPCNTENAVTSYLDAAVNYDKEYDYSVRAVYSFSLSVPTMEKTLKFKYFLNSPY